MTKQQSNLAIAKKTGIAMLPFVIAARAATISASIVAAAFVSDSPRRVERADEELGVRNAHTMVYDASRARVLLIAGADERAVRGDTWQWDVPSRRWSLVTADGPGPRTFAAAAYDAARAETVLFGGNRVLFGETPSPETFLGDTWILKHGKWSRRLVAGPEPRAEAGMAYDRRRRRIVLFGGHAFTPDGRRRFGDTWEWDGGHWLQRSATGPSPRNGMAFAYDESRQRVVLFGGSGRSADTWEWDGNRWTEIRTPAIQPRFNAAMAYDAREHALIRFGGWANDIRLADTWLFRSGQWRERAVSGPAARNHTAMAFDSRRARAVLFGGHDGELVFGDTWEWYGNAWHQAATAEPKRRIANGHVP